MSDQFTQEELAKEESRWQQREFLDKRCMDCLFSRFIRKDLKCYFEPPKPGGERPTVGGGEHNKSHRACSKWVQK